jgi:hypothetical protein
MLGKAAPKLGFDGGRRFLADIGRHLFEADPADGSVVRKFSRCVIRPIGSLTGGPVALEPSTATVALAACAIVSPVARNTRRPGTYVPPEL